jgi:hypothetical protein
MPATPHEHIKSHSLQFWWLGFAAVLTLSILLELHYLPDIVSSIGERAQEAYDAADNRPVGGMRFATQWIMSTGALGLLNIFAVGSILLGIVKGFGMRFGERNNRISISSSDD